MDTSPSLPHRKARVSNISRHSFQLTPSIQEPEPVLLESPISLVPKHKNHLPNALPESSIFHPPRQHLPNSPTIHTPPTRYSFDSRQSSSLYHSPRTHPSPHTSFASPRSHPLPLTDHDDLKLTPTPSLRDLAEPVLELARISSEEQTVEPDSGESDKVFPPSSPRPQSSRDQLLDPNAPPRSPTRHRESLTIRAQRLSADATRRVRNSLASTRDNTGVRLASEDAFHHEQAPIAYDGRGDYVLDEKGRKVRAYKRHPGSNKFYLFGLVMTSAESPLPLLASASVAALLPAAFIVFNAEWLWHDFNGAAGKAVVVLFAYCTLQVWANMLRTAWRDPGILPRGLHQPDMELIACPRGSPEDLGNGMAEQPMNRYIRIKDGLVASKWCQTCATYRPPRTSHCRLCDNCVERTDHHCSWLNNCVGAKNYTTFFALLVFGMITLCLALAFTVTHLVLLHQSGTQLFNSWQPIGSLVSGILILAVAGPFTALFGYHLRLVWLGKTTIEMLRRSEVESSLFGLRHPWTNFVHAVCRPNAPSYVGLRKHARVDWRDDHPSTNPPLV